MEHDIRKSLENVTARLRSAIDAELDSLAAELMQAYERAKDQAKAELDSTVAARVAATRAEIEAAMQSRVAAARAEAERGFEARAAEIRTSALNEARIAAEHQRADAVTAQVSEREGRLEAVERLLASVRRLDAASSLRETLEVLVQSASLETPRVAVLLIEAASVRAFAQRGFAAMPDAGPLASGGVVEACVRQGQPAFTGDSAGLKAPGFAALAGDRAGFAAPLRVGNRTVAVLYADNAGEGQQDAPAAWPEALELLSRHASMHLENLTAMRQVGQVGQVGQVEQVEQVPYVEQQAAGMEHVDGQDDEAARRYAKLLVSEIKLYNEATVRSGREQRALRTMLRDEIEHAEKAYLDRIPETVAARRDYFETELVQTLGGGDPSTLGTGNPR